MAKSKKKNNGVTVATLPSMSADYVPPTPERLAKVGLTTSITMNGRTQIVFGQGQSPVGQDGVIRLSEAPLDRLHARGRLHEGKNEHDRHLNTLLHEQGDRLRNHNTWGQLAASVGGQDLTRSFGGGEQSYGMPSSLRAAAHRDKVRKARAALHPDDWRAVELVVLDERDLADAGRAIGYKNADAGGPVVLDRLRRGLTDLARHWGALPPLPRQIEAANDQDLRVA